MLFRHCPRCQVCRRGELPIGHGFGIAPEPFITLFNQLSLTIHGAVECARFHAQIGDGSTPYIYSLASDPLLVPSLLELCLSHVQGGLCLVPLRKLTRSFFRWQAPQRLAQLTDSWLHHRGVAGRSEPFQLLARRAGGAHKVAPLVAQDLCVGERLRTDFAECGTQLGFGLPFRAQDPVAVGDGWLDENLSPLGDGDRNGIDRLDRRGRIFQRNAVGLNAGKTVTGDVKADTSRRDTELGICLGGDFDGLADALKGFVCDLNLLGLTLGISESFLRSFDIALAEQQVVQLCGTGDPIKDSPQASPPTASLPQLLLRRCSQPAEARLARPATHARVLAVRSGVGSLASTLPDQR